MSKWPINAVDGGYIDETQPTLDQSDGFQRFINDIADGWGELPCQVTVTKQITVPPCQHIRLDGANGRPGPGYLAGPSKIVVGKEIAPTSAPHLTPVIDASRCARIEIDGIAAKLGNYQGFPSVGGVCPTRMSFLRCGGSYFLSRLSIEGFSSEVVLGGGGTFEPNTTGFDHSKMVDCYLDGGLFAVNLLPGSNAAGDQLFESTDFYGSGASIAMAHSASSGLVGVTFVRCGSYAPIAFNAYDDGSGASGGQLGSCNLQSFSAEFGYTAVFFDDLYTAVNGSSVSDNVWTPGFYLSPQRTVQGWGYPMNVVPGSIVDNTVQVVPPPGFVFKPGLMTVADYNNRWVPLATMTANDGAWPYATIPAGKPAANAVAVPVTLTLDKPIDPTITKLQVEHVKLGTIVAGNIADETINGSLMRQSTSYPVFFAGKTNTANTKISDGPTAYAMAKVAPLIGGRMGIGNVWGDRGVCGRSGAMAVQKGCQVGDLLQGQDNGYTLADGTRVLKGWAMRDAPAAGASHDVHGSIVDVQYQGFGGKNAVGPIIARNRTATDIPAFTMCKRDDANPGGICPALDENDGVICTTYTIIPAGGTGQLLESRLR